MIEPLSAFFILEGFGFEIVGVILLAQGISDFFFKVTYPKNEGKIEIEETKEGFMTLNVHSKDRERIEDLVHFRAFKNSKLLKRYANRSSQALPFLVGGFILQAIGIISQLF